MSRLRWEDPPDKTKLMPDEYQGQLAPWSEEGRKRAAKQETKQWSATMDSPIEVEAVAKVCPTFLCRLWGCVCVGWGSCCRCCVRSESVLWLLRLSMGEDGAGDPPPPCLFSPLPPLFCGTRRFFQQSWFTNPSPFLTLCCWVQSTPAPRWLAGKEYRARITRKWKEPPPGPEAPTEAEIDNAVVVAAQGKGAMPHQALERQKTADAGKLMTAAPVVEKR